MRRLVYTNQDYYSDLLVIIQVVDDTDFANKIQSENILDSLSLRFYLTISRLQNKNLKITTESIYKIIHNINFITPSKKEIIKLKTKLLELKNLVQAEIEKEIQPELIAV